MDETATKRKVVKGVWKRYLGWITVSLLAAFLVNNFIKIYFSIENVSSLANAFSWTAIIPFSIYIIAIYLGVWQVKRTLHESFREQAKNLHDFNVYFLRGCFFAVLFIGCIDFLLALFRSTDILTYLVGDATARALGLGNFVGPYLHLPLTVLGFIVARFSRTLGWTWLALLIVFAELIIVMQRCFYLHLPILSMKKGM